MRANPKVRADEGKVCVMWGPLVYTVEETDNGENLQALYIDTAKPVKKSEKEEFPMLIAAGKRICESGWGRGRTLWKSSFGICRNRDYVGTLCLLG